MKKQKDIIYNDGSIKYCTEYAIMDESKRQSRGWLKFYEKSPLSANEDAYRMIDAFEVISGGYGNGSIQKGHWKIVSCFDKKDTKTRVYK